MLQRIRELRRSPRIPKRQAAFIAERGNGRQIPCTIWDISEHGARLAAPHPKALPSTFTLFLSRDGTSQKYCRVAWRSEAQIGVQFLEECDDEVSSSRSPIPRHTQPTLRRSEPANVRNGGREQVIPLQKISLQMNGSTLSGSSASRIAGLSFLAAISVIVLTAATGLFYFAASHIDDEDISWANDVCDSARNFCAHPEITGISALLIVFIFMAAKGMERD